MLLRNFALRIDTALLQTLWRGLVLRARFEQVVKGFGLLVDRVLIENLLSLSLMDAVCGYRSLLVIF